MSNLQIHEDTKALAQAAADHFVAVSEEAIENRGRFTVALSGGSTPQEAYKRLSDPMLATKVSWRNVHLFWGDERCVPPEHPGKQLPDGSKDHDSKGADPAGKRSPHPGRA